MEDFIISNTIQILHPAKIMISFAKGSFSLDLISAKASRTERLQNTNITQQKCMTKKDVSMFLHHYIE
jgi:hypothetical protein